MQGLQKFDKGLRFQISKENMYGKSISFTAKAACTLLIFAVLQEFLAPVKSGQEVVIVRQGSGEYGDGLLKMSFLGGLKYTIDFKRQAINWIP